MRLRQGELAERIGVSNTRIRNLEREGWFKRGKDNCYDVAEVEEVFANFDPDQRASGKTTNGKEAPAKPSAESEPAGWVWDGDDLYILAPEWVAEGGADRMDGLQSAISFFPRLDASEHRPLIASTCKALCDALDRWVPESLPECEHEHWWHLLRPILDEAVQTFNALGGGDTPTDPREVAHAGPYTGTTKWFEVEPYGKHVISLAEALRAGGIDPALALAVGYIARHIDDLADTFAHDWDGTYYPGVISEIFAKASELRQLARAA